MPIGIIESLDHEARGITRLEGKTIFVEGALPGETVEYTSFRRKPNYEVAQADRILKASPDRVDRALESAAEQLFDRIRAVIFQASERGNTEAAILNALVFENLKCVVKNRLHHAARCAGSVAGDVRHVASFAEK